MKKQNINYIFGFKKIFMCVKISHSAIIPQATLKAYASKEKFLC